MSQYRRNISLLSCLILAALFGGQVHAQSLQDAQIGQQEFCNDTGMCNQGAHGPSPRAPDPCFLAQNAMRPCTSVRQQAPTPVGVDPNLIGTWKLPREGGAWVVEIFRDGTYRFHSEAGDGVAPHAGTFSASNGQWLTKATNGYTDGGTYLFQAPDIWISTGQLGTGVWHRPSLKAASRK